ncbi:MAG TPA: methyltransferase, partial [Spirochaetota bacterium]|nr:methyltransferase [Spirochaetota bacterium]
MNILGKPSTNPFLYYSGKITGYAIWAMLPLSAAGVIAVSNPSFTIVLISFISAGTGTCIALAGLIRLGRSVRFGIPQEKTEFKNEGIYRLSRNPIYLGFNLLTIGSVIYHYQFIPVYIAAAYSMTVYHLIILGEERFLGKRFG